MIAFAAAVIAIFGAVFSRKQARAAERQATAAETQAKIARQQAAAAWEQVSEARRANEAVEAERARLAVRWSAKLESGWETITVRNIGTDTARGVQAQVSGTDEDWQWRWDEQGGEDFDFEEVRPGDFFPFSLEDHLYPPQQVYVFWRGAPHPTAVVVEGAPA